MSLALTLIKNGQFTKITGSGCGQIYVVALDQAIKEHSLERTNGFVHQNVLILVIKLMENT